MRHAGPIVAMYIDSMYSIAMTRPTENPTPGYLLWRLTTKLRAAVDRALAPLGLTHAQYSLLASLYGYSLSGAQPSQRELADWTGLEPIYVSKLARALEQAGLIQRAEHPSDTRAVQLRLTDHGADVARRAIAIVAAFQEELTAPIGGTRSQRTRDLVRTLQTLLGADTDPRSDPMAPPATLTGQDIGEAQGAISTLLDRVLATTDSAITTSEYIVLRILAVRGPMASPGDFHRYLASQPQLHLDPSGVAALFGKLEAQGLVTGGSDPNGPGPTQLTPDGHARYTSLADTVNAMAARLYRPFDPDDLATAHRVLVGVIERAAQLRDEL
jgi:DNA-binding MarR family transcriptional regulator